MTFNVTNFLLSLAADLVARANSAEPLATALAIGTDVWIHSADERTMAAGSVYAVLANYGGPVPADLRPQHQISVQVRAAATIAGDGLELAQRLFDCLYTDNAGGRNGGIVRHMERVTGMTLAESGPEPLAQDTATDWQLKLLMPMQPPGIVGREERTGTGGAGMGGGKHIIVFNFDVRFGLMAKES